MDHRILPPTLSHPIREGKRLVIDPGLLDTDSVDMRGVAHRLIYGTILPQDESQYFRDVVENMDICEGFGEGLILSLILFLATPC